jgi:hypothetical protein
MRPVEEPRAIERARRDIEAGELWRARDRLHSYVAQDPWHQGALDLLGEVFWRMGDAPLAGRSWYLTERDDGPAREARVAFERRFPLAGRRAMLRAREPYDRYPSAVQARLASLGRPPPPEEEEGASSLGATLAVLAALLLTVGVWLLGAVTAIVLALRALT